jgi:tetratricopeptide (TPR) repeat protein
MKVFLIHLRVLVVPVLVAGLMAACAQAVYSPDQALDTPQRHVDNGMRFLHAGKVEDAFREFQRAKELDANYAPAYVGLGLSYGLMGNYQKGLETMEVINRLNLSKPSIHP